MQYKILLLHADNIFTHLGISDDDLINQYKSKYSNIDNQITSIRSSQLKNAEELNKELKKHTIVQIISHGHKGGIALPLFGKEEWSYEDLFNNLGIDFKEVIVLLNTCYGGNLDTLNQSGIPNHPSFLLAYSNTLDHYKGAIILFSYIHQKIKDVFLSIKTTDPIYKVNDEVYTLTVQGDENFFFDITNKEIEIFGHTKITSSDDPGVVIMSRSPRKT